jgi:hypothetical protein
MLVLDLWARTLHIPKFCNRNWANPNALLKLRACGNCGGGDRRCWSLVVAGTVLFRIIGKWGT